MSSNLPKGWEEKELKKVANITMGQSPKSSSYNEKGEGEIFYQGVTDFGELYPSIKKYTTEPKKIAIKGDILFSVRAPVGTLNIANNKCCIGRGISSLSMKNNENRFLFYLLKYNQTVFENLATGTTFTAVNKKDIETFEVKLPSDINEQKRIADILSAFDDKIEINNQINQSLEEMASAIFKEWFENFNFPNNQGKAYKDNGGEMKASELGEIPIDWEVKNISDIAENISRRFNLKKHKEVVFVNTGDVLNGEFLHKNYKKVDSLPGQAKKAIEEGDILYSEIRPKNKRFARVDTSVKDYVVSTKFMVIKRNENIGYNCLYIFLTKNSTIEEFNIIAESRSGTFPQITFDSISGTKIVLPCESFIMNKFESLISPIFEQITLNKEQNKILKQQRDTLLPKLMSGDIKV